MIVRAAEHPAFADALSVRRASAAEPPHLPPAELLNTLIEKITVHEAVKGEDGSREQEVDFRVLTGQDIVSSQTG